MPADRVLVDTSVWIAHFNQPRHPLNPTLRSLQELGRACTTGMVLAELLQGARTQREVRIVDALTVTTTTLKDSLEAWKQAGRLSAQLRRKGLTISLLDCLLATTAVEHRVSVLSFDRHFRLIAKHFPLELEPAVPL